MTSIIIALIGLATAYVSARRYIIIRSETHVQSPTTSQTSRTTGITLEQIAKAIFVILGFAVYVGIPLLLIRSCNEEEKDLMTTLKADSLPRLQCSIDELSKSTRSNKVAALNKHKGASISGGGTIYEVDVGGWANQRRLSVSYQIGDSTMIAILLIIPEDSLDITKVSVGMPVNFRGVLNDLQLLQDGTPILYLEPAIIVTAIP